MWFLPRTEGFAPIRSEPEAFIRIFACQVETGLFPRASSTRSRYTVTRQARDSLSFRAVNWLTAFNVGLNEVELSASTGQVRYTIEYRRWAAYGVLLSAAIGLTLAVVFLAIDIRDYVDRHPGRMIPGLTTDQNVAIGWAMVIFWGFVWPWILVGLHKRPLRRLMDRLIEEVDQSARTPSARQPSS
jgi:hypothetical protein